MENAVNSVNTYVGIEDPDDLGTFVDVSDKAHNVRMGLTIGNVDSSTFGQGDMTNVQTMRGGSFQVDFYSDDDLRDLMWAIFNSGASIRVRYGPEGSDSGKERLTASFNLTNFEPTGAVNSLNASPATFVRTGATTRDTF